MKDLRYLNHNLNQRITFDTVLTRTATLIKENLEGMATGLGGQRNAVMFGGRFLVKTGLTFEIEEDSFFIHKLSKSQSLPVISNGFIDVSVAAAHPALIRFDTIEAKVELVNENQSLQDQINPLTQVVTPQLFNVDRRVKLTISVNQGTPGAGSAPVTTPAAAAVFISTVDFSSTLDLSSAFNINISIDGAAFVEVDCRGGTPSATTRAEVVAVLNGAGFGTIAFTEGTDFIRIESTTIGDGSSIRIIPSSGNEGVETILGLSEEGTFFHKFEGEFEFFKIGEIRVPAAAVSLVSGDLRDVYNKSQWTTLDQAEDLVVIEPVYNVSQSVLVGEFKMVSFNVLPDFLPNSEFYAFCGLDGNKPSGWAGLVEGDPLPTDRFTGGNVPQLDDNRFLQGSSSAGSGGGGNVGDNTHSLIEAEMPSHAHSISSSGDHMHTLSIVTDGNHNHNVSGFLTAVGDADQGNANFTGQPGNADTTNNGNHNHGGSTADNNGDHDHGGFTGNGNGTAQAFDLRPRYFSARVFMRIK